MFKKLWLLTKSLFISVEKAVVADPEVKSMVKKHPRFFAFLKQRFEIGRFGGLIATILILVIFYIIFLLAGAIEDVVRSDVIVAADVRVANLLLYFRNPAAIKFFFLVSVFGKTLVVAMTALIFSIFLWLVRKKVYILVLWLILIGSQSFTFLGKVIFHRPRPAVASYLETSASFPSAHASVAVVLFGFIIYVAWRSTIKKKTRIAITLLGLIAILLIGFSRLYLGVHFVSDVWVGYLVGFLWLAIGISFLEWYRQYQKPVVVVRKYKLAGATLFLVFLVAYSIFGGYYLSRFKPNPTVDARQNVVSAPLDIFSVYNANRYSETLIGVNQEPISLVVVASSDEALITDSSLAGWSLSGRVNFKAIIAMAKRAVFNQDYPTAPMTPVFWNGQVHDFGWEKDTDKHSVRQRHHARFWKTDFKTADGKNIYVGTVSLDVGIKWLITHRISPDIDTERELIVQDLQKIGVVESSKKEKFVSPVLGKNFSGDQFFTDGQAHVLWLK